MTTTNGDLESAKRYRDLANGLRAKVAAGTVSRENVEPLLKMAAEYEGMARTKEAMHRCKKVAPGWPASRG